MRKNEIRSFQVTVITEKGKKEIMKFCSKLVMNLTVKSWNLKVVKYETNIQ